MATTPQQSVSTQLIQLAPSVGEHHAAFSKSYQDFFGAVFDHDALEPKTRAAVALCAALMQDREETVRSFLAAAKKLGLKNEEIGQIAGIVEAMKLDKLQRPAVQAVAAAAKKANTCC
ncbi:carboxymuconolactone decarboxylase family protein [Streptomyces sp. CA-256286]|uniref:carboxymuconolactone decarboxylase family protein n=1 Tax=Streptomyces sp. CA-256286 TaxID=2801033 RepID=UPI001A991847|nr:carboxymuconolactone decarboxylase family protein [Streptomyces sp. CA-256286]QTA30214.1 Carboxymuconolactone decarboxylase family protein [Streptomyces sp. CA-256286]